MFKHFLNFFIAILIGCSCNLISAEPHPSYSHQIIFINGPSSAGKSTLAFALQQELDQPFLHIGIDSMIEMMPQKINDWEGGYAPQGFSWKQGVDETGVPICEIELGPFAQKVRNETFVEVVKTLAKGGHYLIIDDISFGKTEIDAWKAALKDYKVLWVGITVPLDVIEAREKARGNRLLGQARGMFFKVHKDVAYDFEFDTSKEPLDKVVKTIKDAL